MPIQLYQAKWATLNRLYKGIASKIDVAVSIQQRDNEIRQRYGTGGESIPDLAKVFGLSNARVHQILHGW